MVALPSEDGTPLEKWFMLRRRYLSMGRPAPMSEGSVPCIVLSDTASIISEDTLRRSAGIVPEIWFPATMNDSSPWILPKPMGMVPSRWLVPRLISLREERLVSDWGITPVKLFGPSSTPWSFDRPPSQSGIPPVSWFLPSLMLTRLLQFLRPAEISLWSELFEMSRYRSRYKRPTVTGISPCSMFWLRSRLVRNVKLPTDAGMVPARPAELRSSAETLPLCLWLHFTPGQRHRLTLVFQEDNLLDCWPRMAFSSSKASRSVSLLNCAADA